MSKELNNGEKHPTWVQELEKSFGGANQTAFGTAVFYQLTIAETVDVEQLARKWYQFFCGPSWEKLGADSWLGTWKRVDLASNKSRTLLDELANLEDHEARRSAATMLEGHEDPSTAKKVLSQVMDDPAVEERRIYKIGDGGAMSGILIVCQRNKNEFAFLTFLLD